MSQSFEAVIFDMDGVIFDSERAVMNCWIELAAKYNIPNIEKPYFESIGTTKSKTAEIMRRTYGADFPYEEYTKETSSRYHEKYDGGRLPMKAGIEELLKTLKANGKKIALASSTGRKTVENQLRDAGLIQYFDAIICGDMITKSKPDPEIFIKAAEALSVQFDKTFVIEDSYNGIRGAKAAGMRPLMVPDLLPPNEEMKEISEKILLNLYEIEEYLFHESKPDEIF